MAGCIATGDADPEAALVRARAFPGLAGMDLAKVVTRSEAGAWDGGGWTLGSGYGAANGRQAQHVVAYDFGVKRNILRMLVDRGCEVTVVPAQTPAEEALALLPDGIFLSNGPGDPEPCDYAIEAIRAVLGRLAGVRHLSRSPATRAGLWWTNGEDAVRPPRRESSGQGCRHRGGRHHQPEPRFSRWTANPSRTTSKSPTSRCSMAPCKEFGVRTCPRSDSRGTPRRVRDRTTAATCSTASSG